MEFNDLQTLWNTQNEDALFAIHHEALYATIRRKAKNIHRLVEFFEWVMIGVNLAAGLYLFFPSAGKGGYPFLIPAAYTAFALIALVRRLRRHREERPFPPTFLGELDKALFRLDYLIQQGRAILWWYVLPFTAVIGVAAWFNPQYRQAFFFILLMIPASYLGTRWENNKFHLPKKRALEALRAQLTAPEPN
ncbi:MAG: hypothetical protein H6636_09140 [Anaerolineales bacterium]|nr:hypothetical protein [Anaerolineales bacterium]